MRELTDNDLIHISGAHFLKKLFPNVESIEATPTGWRMPSVAGGLFLVTTVLGTAATIAVKPNTPLWGLPATISLGLGLSVSTYLIHEALEWASPSTITYVIHRKH